LKIRKRLFYVILGTCVTIAILVGLFNYFIILDVKEDTVHDISSLNTRLNVLNSTDRDLLSKFTILNITDSELLGKLEVLEELLQSSLPEEYDYLLSSRESRYYVKSGVNGTQMLVTTEFSEAFQYALDNGRVVIISSGSYVLNSDITIKNKSNIVLDGFGAVLNLNDHSISVLSNHYANNSNNQIRNFVVINGTFRFENSFKATVENMFFADCESAIEIANTDTWSEATKLENIYWENCQTALTFKTPSGNATASYENTALDRCYINLYQNNSVGIMVEKDAEVANSQWTNMRIWLHANKNQTQTGLSLEGSMSDTLLSDVVFESFGDGTIYGIYLGSNSETGFSLGEGTSFLGTFDARIKNPEGKWVYGAVSVFKEEETIPFGESVIIQRYPLTIGSFDAFITIENLVEGEEVTVKLNLNFIDHTSNFITLNFVGDTTYWLTEQDLYKLYPPQNVIWNIEANAQTNLLISQTKVSIGVIGTVK
jgi:hypothetical protein